MDLFFWILCFERCLDLSIPICDQSSPNNTFSHDNLLMLLRKKRMLPFTNGNILIDINKCSFLPLNGLILVRYLGIDFTQQN